MGGGRPGSGVVWTPQPGPQTTAFLSAADRVFYGGAAGGGKTDLLLGLAALGHRRSIVFRREYPQLRGIEERARELYGSAGRYNATTRLWRLGGGRTVEFGAVALPGDVVRYQGRAHDLKAFDEITHFTEAQFRFLIGWLRTAEVGQRTQVVATGNPPTGAEGDWVIRYWAPWLDRRHPNPALPGELRWFAALDGVDAEVPDDRPIERAGETIRPHSRTFIRARVEDNAFLMAAGYKATLQALPEPLRSRMLEGAFDVGAEDDPYQVIPTAWVEAAQQRWTAAADDSERGPVSALGVDVARGGSDRTVVTVRRGIWFDWPIAQPGTATPDGPAVIGLLLPLVSPGTMVNIDVIGVGAAVYDAARGLGLVAIPLNGAEASTARDKSGQLGFINQRAEYWWRLREALDPASGESLAIPPDPELLADLIAPRWTLRPRGIQIEGKPDIMRRIGRSPDKGDSLVYAHAVKFQADLGFLRFIEEEHTAFLDRGRTRLIMRP
ncbi:MAG TPA: terminase [Stellaceae bacterium]|nr:terminase [Stellaceae bacterium]